MFHQVQVRQEDRPSQRFLWRGNNRSNKPDEYEMVAMIFGTVCSPASATFVMRKNAKEFEKQYPEVAKAVCEQHYVDDYLDSADTEEDAIHRVASVIEVHKRGGFIIRNWSSNSKKLLKSIPSDLRTGERKDMYLDQDLPIERILGLFWNPNDDTFSFSIKWNEHELKTLINKNVTKREVLKTVMSIFDPFGFLSNFSIKAKILLQNIWRTKIAWDEKLNTEFMKRWKIWVKEIGKIEKLSIPRCYIRNVFEAQEIQLHIFCDASVEAYACVGYLRIKMKNLIKTSFVMAKSRVAPLKPTSIPRLELQAAILGSRMAVTILESHNIKIDCSYYWSDSQTVITWLKTEDKHIFKPFVAHRVTEIIEITDSNKWRWLPTKENVADEATREDSLIDWGPESRWLNGPSFLKFGEEKWPNEQSKVFDTSEVRKKFIGITLKITDNLKSLFEIRRFSLWIRLIRTTAWLLRFIKKTKKICSEIHELIPAEIVTAEKKWIKSVQSEDFACEVECLKKNLPLDCSSRLFKLSPFLDNECILRIKSRTVYSRDLVEDAKFPIILHPRNYFTKLLISHYHIKAAHTGQEYVVNELRQKYWILNIRSAVRSSWNNCQWCKNKRAKPAVPEMSPLPISRLTSFVRAFTIVGMDYFGPMFVTVGRRKEKRYGVLFTCMSTRAVHLEIAPSLNTDSAIMAIRRLIGRRGNPTKILSDNGTNFKGAEKELREALKELDQDKITSSMTSRNIEWYFIPPSAPHMGGSWERLVRSIKTTLREILKERAPREEILQTLFVEAEHIVNSRPLVHVSLDHADSEALTPNHFLLGSSNGAPSPGKFTEKDLVTRKQWRISQTLTEHFWRRWVREYLPVLTKRTKWFKPCSRQIKVGDIVIIIEPSFSRNSWPKGIITTVYPSADGQIRVVDVRTNLGTFRRPVAKLCILDVTQNE